VGDWVSLATYLIEDEGVSGPVNATAPLPVTNAELSKEIGRAMGRPSWLPAPAPALRIGLGEMADALLLSSQRVVPQRATELGFVFRFTALGDALNDVLR
jgi:NAD dependent epimerase/dehydratase family enzyme